MITNFLIGCVLKSYWGSFDLHNYLLQRGRKRKIARKKCPFINILIPSLPFRHTLYCSFFIKTLRKLVCKPWIHFVFRVFTLSNQCLRLLSKSLIEHGGISQKFKTEFAFGQSIWTFKCGSKFIHWSARGTQEM